MKNDSKRKTFLVAGLTCLVCSIFVSLTAVFLRPKQEANRILDMKKNLLMTAGLISKNQTSTGEILDAYKRIEAIVIDLETGARVNNITPDEYDQRKAAKDPKLSIKIDPVDDVAQIRTREKFSKVYFVRNNGSIESLILPIYGMGLWAMMYGFIVLEADAKTVKGFGFYEHGETPGLGAEIDNTAWKAGWIGKAAYDDSCKMLIHIEKGRAQDCKKAPGSAIDGLAGATLTANAVENVLHYWLGVNGFAPFVAKFRNKEFE